MKKSSKLLVTMCTALVVGLSVTPISANEQDMNNGAFGGNGAIGDNGAVGDVENPNSGNNQNDNSENEGSTPDSVTDEVNIVDNNLKQALKETLGLENSDLTEKNLSTIKTLNIENRGISNLSGLEKCTNLETLNINGNSVTDFSPILQLPSLNEAVIGTQTINISTTLSYDPNNVVRVKPMGITGVDGKMLEPNGAEPSAALISLKNTNGEIEFDGKQLVDTQSISYSMDGEISKGVQLSRSGGVYPYTINVIQPIHANAALDEDDEIKKDEVVDGDIASNDKLPSVDNKTENVKNDAIKKPNNKKDNIKISKKLNLIKKDNLVKFEKMIETINKSTDNRVIKYYQKNGNSKSMKEVMLDCNLFNTDLLLSISKLDPLRMIKLSKENAPIATGDNTNNDSLILLMFGSLLMMITSKFKKA